MLRVRDSWQWLLPACALAALSSCSLLFSPSNLPEEAADGGRSDDGRTDGRTPCEDPLQAAIRASEPTRYYRAEEEQGSEVATDSGFGTNTLDGSYAEVNQVTLGRLGLSGNALTVLSGLGNSSLRVPPAVLDLSKSFTVEFFFKSNGPPDMDQRGLFIYERYGVFSNDQKQGGEGFRLTTKEADGSGDKFRVYLTCEESGCNKANVNSEQEGMTLLEKGVWYHVILLHQLQEGSGLHLFRVVVNDVVELNITGMPMIDLGNISASNTGFGGVSAKTHSAIFDEMAIYDRELSAQTISAHYAAFLDQPACTD